MSWTCFWTGQDMKKNVDFLTCTGQLAGGLNHSKHFLDHDECFAPGHVDDSTKVRNRNVSVESVHVSQSNV